MAKRFAARIIVLAAFAVAAAGCAGEVGKNGTSCTITDNTDGSKTLACSDGTSMTIANGEDGKPGVNGKSCTVTDNGNGTKTITCEDGTSVTVANGHDGQNGQPCTVVDNGNGTKTITCADGTVIVTDGKNGTNGTNGTNGKNGGNVEVKNFHGTEHLLADELETAAKFYANATITAATADAAGLVTVNFTVNDKAGKPVTTITAIQADIAKLVPGAAGSNSKWVPYINRLQTNKAGSWPKPVGFKACQATREGNGTLTNLGNGQYSYVFAKKLATAADVTCDDGTVTPAVPVAYERNLTHRVSVMMGGHNGPTADASFDFVPADPTAVITKREIVKTATCLDCHGPEFAGHGGDRLTVENCVTCHVEGQIDPNGGESIDMTVMIHKIHAGGELTKVMGPDGKVYDDPATPGDESADNGEYAIWGNSDSKHSWKGEFPAVLSNCQKCHTGNGAQVDNWKTVPTKKACGSCHDNIDWTVAHHGAVRTDNSACALCHGPDAIANDHDWTTKDIRNVPEFTYDLSVKPPANTKYFVAGERPVVKLVIKKNGTALADHHIYTDTASPNPDHCTTATGPCDGNGKFKSSKLFVTGPRSNRQPALTYVARAKIAASGVGPFDLSAASGSLILKVDGGQNTITYDVGGGDVSVPGTITVLVPATGAFATPTAATAAEIVAWLNADAKFKARAIAYIDRDGKPAIRSRGLGTLPSIQLQASSVATTVFAGDLNIKTIGGSTISATVADGNTVGGTDPTKKDPNVAYFADRIEYTLDDVVDAKAGTYVVDLEFSDIGNNGATDYRTPSVKWTTFQVKTETVEKLVADNCNSCHQASTGKGYVLDFPRHNKQFTTDAVDHCAACHDYQPQNATGAAFTGAVPISRRVHAVHNGVNLTYPLGTVAHEDGTPGRQWQITYPMDIRNCESCHSAATTGTWATKANRLACGGCHDSDAATAHIKLMTYDPTPADAFSGDEQESCQACH